MPRMPSLLLFWSPFDSMPWGSERHTPEWIEHRFAHWQAYTLGSILRQTEPDFRYWLVMNPANRALTEALRTRVGDERVELVYADEWPARLRGLPPCDRYLLARLDSDDLYHPRAAARLLRGPFDRDFLQFDRGWAWDVDTGEMRDWSSASSPFYCRVHGEEVRAIGEWSIVNHSTVRPRARVLGPGHFLVTFHGRNTSSTIARGGGRPLPAERAAGVLEAFGVRPAS